MKTTKRLLAVLLALVLLCVGVPFAAQAEAVQTGDLIEYGTYPQTKVAETTALKNAANAAVWKSYDYFTGTGSRTDGNMTPSDYMVFADFFCNGTKYRAVKFTQYRPYYTGYQSNASNTYQDDNGYEPNTTYYFKYEPLTWRILDPSTGYIMCESIVDSQAYQNTIYSYYQAINSSVYANDYATSSIRTWLNHDFYETAFTASQKENIKTTALNNDAYSTDYAQYNSAATNDKIFLLSWADALNTSYGFSSSSSNDTARRAQGTDYAKCQGLWVSTSSDYSGNSVWWLRSPGYDSDSACSVYSSGGANDYGSVSHTSNGVRPACKISNLTSDISQSDNLFSAGTHDHQAGEPVHENEQPATCISSASYESITYCTLCGEEMSRETVYEGDPLGHLEQTYTTASTCAENGFTITICTRCGETLSKEILPRLDHNWTSEVTQNPTCTAQGVKTYTCADCGETYTEPVDILAHEWDEGKMTKAPSCTEAGEMTYTCATGGETRTEPIDKLDHEIVLVAGKAASCTESGLTDGWQCKNCKKWFAEQQTIPALDHDPQIGAVVEPTCTDPGYTPFICTRCGETVSKTDPTEALGHNMQPTYVWAKDDSTVTATMVCTRCDKTGATETAEVKTEITVKPTCSTEGELTLIAAFNNKSFYGQTKTKTLPRDPNAHVFKVTVTPPTCLDDGYTTHACTLCRYGYSDEIVFALGHDYQHHDAKAPTCEAPGWDAYDTCSRCDYTTYSELATVDHDDANNDGKCDMCGIQMQGGSHCKYCGKVHNGNFFDKLTGFFHRILAIFKR